MPVQIAKWDSARDAWTDESRIDLFSELSDAFLGTFPTSGMTVNGEAYERPTWEPRTPDSGSLSLQDDAMLGTPTARMWKGASEPGTKPFEKQLERGKIEAQVKLLLTPVAKEGEKATFQQGSEQKAKTGQVWLTNQIRDIHDLNVRTLPTPTTSDTTGPGVHGEGGLNLRTAVTLLPTPVAQPSGGSPENHLRKKPGRKVVTDLAILTENGLLESGGKLLPTTTTMDANGSRNATANRKPGAKFKAGTTLTDALLPTPKATDGTKGGPNQRGSSGDLTLPSASVRIGATTSQPSVAGSKSSDAQLPGQLSLLDAMEQND